MHERLRRQRGAFITHEELDLSSRTKSSMHERLRKGLRAPPAQCGPVRACQARVTGGKCPGGQASVETRISIDSEVDTGRDRQTWPAVRLARRRLCLVLRVCRGAGVCVCCASPCSQTACFVATETCRARARMHVCLRACVRMSMSMCVRARARVVVIARARVVVYVCVCVSLCVYARARGCVCVVVCECVRARVWLCGCVCV